MFVGARGSTSTRQAALTLREAVSAQTARLRSIRPELVIDARDRLARLDLRRVAGAAAGLLAFGGAGVGFVLYAPMTRVAQVVVSTPAGASDSLSDSVSDSGGDAADRAQTRAIIAAAGVTLGEPLVKVDLRQVEERVAALGRYRRVEASRAWLDEVRIDVLPRIPVVALTSSGGSGGGAVRLVDETGVAYDGPAQAPPELPVATLADVRDAAQRQAAVAAVAALDVQRRAQVRGLEVNSAGQVRMSLGEVEVQWGGADDGALKAAVVAALVDRAGIRTLDVRAPQRPVTTG